VVANHLGETADQVESGTRSGPRVSIAGNATATIRPADIDDEVCPRADIIDGASSENYVAGGSCEGCSRNTQAISRSAHFLILQSRLE
jgi:hypothetical protein